MDPNTLRAFTGDSVGPAGACQATAELSAPCSGPDTAIRPRRMLAPARPVSRIIDNVDGTSQHSFNRHLSLLQFHQRVLAQAQDPRIPVLERLRFLCIACSNVDEFFEIQFAELRRLEQNHGVRSLLESESPAKVLAAVRKQTQALVAAQYSTLNCAVLPALASRGVRVLARSCWTPAQRAWLTDYFRDQVLALLLPITLDAAHPFPCVASKSLNFAVVLSGHDAFGRDAGCAIVPVPDTLAPVIRLPARLSERGACDFVLLEAVIHAHAADLFPCVQVAGCFAFRVTRDAELTPRTDPDGDLLRALADELPRRLTGEAMRLDIALECPEHVLRDLLGKLKLSTEDVYRCTGPVNVASLAAICDSVHQPALRYPPLRPRVPEALAGDLFAALRARDHLLHCPYDSFLPVINLLWQAARDPDVLAISVTLYRTGGDSPVVAALVAAAAAGKAVTVVVELRARFDEAANIGVARVLRAAGAHVVYGVAGHKTHAKMALIVRREAGCLRSYAHLATGNYHAGTACQYVDYGLLTADAALCEDVRMLFLQLTGGGHVTNLTRLLESPFSLADGLRQCIERETSTAVAGRPARIIAKLNALVDPEMIEALYRASAAGVDIDLIVRGMCTLRPGAPGVSDHIRVRSIVGRFLEHDRVVWFANDGDPQLWLSSADWRERNLRQRIEIAFPVRDPALRARIERELEGYLADTAQSWLLQPDGRYAAPDPRGAGPSIQQRLLDHATELARPGNA